ncbi:MAG: DegT/DnrJ/EryC1/StrS family aminotransferase [Lentisphaerae bacterium]|nr:DegT/DnrJ/EryC1/StrS family aminotransferase [Lentisphaerota bacterium]
METKMSEKSGGDFRYSVGESKVPWHAVGEFFNGADALELIKFLLPDSGSADYQAALTDAGNALAKLAEVSGRATKLTLGKKVAEAEAGACRYFGSKYACFTSNWTGGMEIAYKLAGIGPGDEVIMPAVTFIATMAYPLSMGAKIVFADIDPETINLDPEDLEKKITPKTKMIVPVHLGGFPVDMAGVMAVARKHGIPVMEDAAHGMGGAYQGRKLGSIGDFGGFSLHEVKNINSLGEGGILLTSDDFYGKQLSGGRFLGLDFSRKIKDWLYDISPLTDKNGGVQVAQNHSATEIQALGLILQMKRLDQIIAIRRRAAEYMNGVLSEEKGILTEKADTVDTYGTHHLYLLRIDPKTVGGNIQQLAAKLAARGLTNITHFGPMYRFKIMRDLGYNEHELAASCPRTEEMFYHSYTHLPLYPLTEEQLVYQAQAVVEAVRELKQGK